jgi:hypothetical protein
MPVLREVDGAEAALTETADEVIPVADDAAEQGVPRLRLMGEDLGHGRRVALTAVDVRLVDLAALRAYPHGAAA